jgi:Glycosyl hydrolases family 28
MAGIFASLAAAFILTTIAGPAVDAGRVVTYPAPAGQPLNKSFSVRVRPAGGEWQPLDVYRVTVDKDTYSTAAMVAFDTDGPVEVEVAKASGSMRSVRVRPLSYGIPANVAPGAKTATFTLPRPLDVSFEVDGDTLRNLHVFASPIESDVPSAGPRVMFFGPGLHPIPDDHVLDVPSNTTVYIAGGAVLQGSLDITNARNVVVRGRGIIDPSRFFPPKSRSTIRVRRSTDVGIRDITLLRAQDGGITLFRCSRAVVSGVREITTDPSSDGIFVTASRDVLVDDVFLRTSDDSIAVYATTPGYGKGSTRNITVRNSALWPDVAHAFLTGTHGDPAGDDVVQHLELQNIDVLEHDEFRGGNLYQGALAVNAGDRVTVRDVRFDDIRIEDFARGQVVNLKVFRNHAYNQRPGKLIDRVLFRNVVYTGTGDRPSQIKGYDRLRRVTNVTFEGFVRNGKTVLDAASGNVDIGHNTTRIVFRRQPPTRTVGDTAGAVRYAGRWLRRGEATSHAGGVRVPVAAGSRMTYGFVGRQARVYGLTGPAAGKVDVYVDGAYAATVDTYSALPRARQIWFDTGVLTGGAHTLELRYLRAKNILATGAAIGFDMLEIVA